MGLTSSKKKYQKVPIKIGMGIAIAIRFVSFIFFHRDEGPNEKNYMYFEWSPPSFFFRTKRGEIFWHDSDTRAFRAEGAERIFYVIATQEPFAPKARRIFSSRIRKKMATNSPTKIYLISMRFEHFFGFGQNFRKMPPPNLKLEVGRRVEQRWPSATHRRWCRAC